MSKIKDGNQIIFPKERPGRVYTSFKQSIVDVLEPLYQQQCKDIEAMLDELPPGSHIGSCRDNSAVYEVVVQKANGGTITISTGSIAAAYEEAMRIVTSRRAAF